MIRLLCQTLVILSKSKQSTIKLCGQSFLRYHSHNSMTITGNDYLQSAVKTGLSAKAASVYVTLLEAGTPLRPKAIILRTSLHRQYVYDALHELEERRLVVSVGAKRAIKYQAASPDHLLQ